MKGSRALILSIFYRYILTKEEATVIRFLAVSPGNIVSLETLCRPFLASLILLWGCGQKLTKSV